MRWSSLLTGLLIGLMVGLSLASIVLELRYNLGGQYALPEFLGGPR